MLTFQEIYDRFHHDTNTGLLCWKRVPEITQQNKSWNTRWAGKAAGSIKDSGYLHVTLHRKHHLVHKIIWTLVYGEWPSFFIDHEDRNKLNNKIDNLRKATQAQNMHNITKPVTNTSGYKGVCRKRKGWFVQIRCNGKQINLGYFPIDKLEEAAECYRQAALKYHKNFSCF